MKCCSDDKSCVRLCPISFGLAIGTVTAVVVLILYCWLMYQGIPDELVGRVPELTFGSGVVNVLWAFVKGTVLGFFVALIYDFFIARCKQWCLSWNKKKQ